MSFSRPTGTTAGGTNAADGTSLAEGVCLPYLLGAQNEDGGWGFAQGLESRAEPTSWGLLALGEISAGTGGTQALSRGYRFLERAQLTDGSWPSAPGQAVGSWVTSLACWALLVRDGASPELAAGVRWLRRNVPGDARFSWRLVRRLVASASRRRVNAQNERYWGWSWTERTASWVEPTAQALIVLRSAQLESPPRDVEQRQELAETMLYDRMCPGGGWNCGNPMIYGVPGEPLVGPTVWALLALRAHAERQENQISLEWLAQNWVKVQSPGSLALTDIGLEAYGRKIPEIGAALRNLYVHGEFAWDVPAVAWTALATSGKMNWLNRTMPNKTSGTRTN
jgi:hypothetical protein